MSCGFDNIAFLNAFYRMTSHRVISVTTMSDNYTNFVRGEKEFKRISWRVGWEQDIKIWWRQSTIFGTSFYRFNVLEIVIKSKKKAIKAVVGNADMNNEGLMTIFNGVESLMNLRPVTYQSANPAAVSSSQFAQSLVDEKQSTLKKCWRNFEKLGGT